MQCTATSKRSGEQCKRQAVTGRKVCPMHGGTQRVGAANQNYKTGRYSQYVPKHLAESFTALATDTARLDLSENIALIDVRLNELLRSIDHGGTTAHWQAVSELADTLGLQLKRKLYEKAETTLTQIKDTIGAGMDDSKVWAEITALGENRRKLTETEQKRLISTDMMIQADRAYGLIAVVQDIILRNVSDPRTLTAITNELGTILNRAVDQRVEPQPYQISGPTA